MRVPPAKMGTRMRPLMPSNGGGGEGGGVEGGDYEMPAVKGNAYYTNYYHSISA